MYKYKTTNARGTRKNASSQKTSMTNSLLAKLTFCSLCIGLETDLFHGRKKSKKITNRNDPESHFVGECHVVPCNFTNFVNCPISSSKEAHTPYRKLTSIQVVSI